MKESRLIKIFQQLNKKEISALGKFVQSPYHNQRKDVIILYQFLQKAFQNPNKLNLGKLAVFPYIFPNEKYQEKKLRYTMSFLYKIIKDYLAIQTFQSNKANTQIAVIQSFRKKGFSDLFEQEYRNAINLLEKAPFRNQEYYFQNYLLENERYLFTTNHTRKKAEGLVEYATHLDHFFIINKLRQSARALSHTTLDSSGFTPTFLNEILAPLDKENTFINPAIAIYYHCFKILSTSHSLPYFKNLRQLTNKYSTYFPPRELQDIYMFALNYCIKRLNAQEMAFGREAFELYKEGLQQGIFIENGILSRFNYKNIVALGLGLKEFDWVALFIENYKSNLEKKYRESAYCYNLAMLHYRTENYGEAMKLLQQVGTMDVLNNLMARRMLVCIYYDQGEFEALYSLLDSFQNYLYRKSGLEYHRRAYLNFIKFTRKLLQLEGMSATQIRQLRRKIVDTKNIVEKDWLLNRLR